MRAVILEEKRRQNHPNTPDNPYVWKPPSQDVLTSPKCDIQKRLNLKPKVVSMLKSGHHCIEDLKGL